jgi:hypothetical protein
MKRSLYFAIGFWLASRLFRRQTVIVDPLMRIRSAGF